MALDGLSVGVLVADGSEQIEVTTPRDALRRAGASVRLLSPDGADVRGYHYIEPGGEIPVDGPISDADGDDLDALVLPGGLGGPDTLRKEEAAVALVRKMASDGAPIGVICHGPWLLIDAEALGGRTLTCVPQLRADVVNAGGAYRDEDVHVDRGRNPVLVSGRDHNTARDFARALVKEFQHARQGSLQLPDLDFARHAHSRTARRPGGPWRIPARKVAVMDITELIGSDHHEQRRMFALLDEVGNSPDRLRPVWDRLVVLLEVHADAEERLFYPRLLEIGRGAGGAQDAPEETEDAIRDHNDIRDAIRRASRLPVGSKQWWNSVRAVREANSDHIAEEERESLPDFRRHASLQERHDLAVEFAVFEAAHAGGLAPRDVDPDAYLHDHAPGG